LQQWHDQQPQLLAELTLRLVPFEQMLETRSFLLDQRLRFVDLDLFGMLANFLYSGHYQLPAAHPQIQRWYERLKEIKHSAGTDAVTN
jgi:glutathione S-transferase